jgi:hypothetical protein
MMTEDFLYYLWSFYLTGKELHTCQKEALRVVHPGYRNEDSGPDFFNARVRIGQTLWAGNIEIHVNASDWFKHNHQNDPAYDSIILHVVYQADSPIYRKNGELVPTLELKGIFDESLYRKYQGFILSDQWIACERDIGSVDHFIISNWLYRLAVERLEQKAKTVAHSLALAQSDFNEVFYIHLLRSFGFKTNSEAFEQLARALPYAVLAKHKSSLIQLEALLFGQAGLLKANFKDRYPQQLKQEYEFLAAKYSLKPLKAYIWKFMRMRPSNFPSIRMAQFAQLVFHSSGLIHKILEANRLNDVINLLQTAASSYWKNHYRFDHTSPTSPKRLGKASISLILINTIIPYLFVYADNKQDSTLKTKAINWLTQLPPEKNTITRHFQQIQIEVQNAMHSQALIQLKNHYCDQKLCLHCAIGHQILKPD